MRAVLNSLNMLKEIYFSTLKHSEKIILFSRQALQSDMNIMISKQKFWH